MRAGETPGAAESRAAFEDRAHPVLAVACRDCRAEVGRYCVRPSGHRAGEFHAARKLDADLAFVAAFGEDAWIERIDRTDRSDDGGGWRVHETGRETGGDGGPIPPPEPEPVPDGTDGPAEPWHAYSPGHPWWYHLGGPVLGPRAIRDRVAAGSYRGYRAEAIDRIAAGKGADRKLRTVRTEIAGELRRDLAGYRSAAAALRLRRNRAGPEPDDPDDRGARVSSDIDQAVALKFNHVWNGFANLRTVDAALGGVAEPLLL